MTLDDNQEKQGIKKKLINFYDKNYKKLLIIPIILLVLALAQIAFQTATTGDFINKDVSLKGGIVLTIPLQQEVNTEELDSYLSSKFPNNDISVKKIKELGVQKAIVIEADIEGQQSEIDSLIKETESSLNTDFKENYTIEVMGSSLGASFFKEVLIALLLAFVFMGIVVFLYFRIPVPSLAVILAAFSDIAITIAVINLMGIKISTAGIAAFLMLIGYSVDTDILLTTRVLKRKEHEVIDRVLSALKTGLTMSFTTMAALIVGLIFTRSEVITQIMTILLIGLIIDLINTWIQNVAILRMYVERKVVKHEEKA